MSTNIVIKIVQMEAEGECLMTEDLISDITNQLILRIGVADPQNHDTQAQQQLEQLQHIREALEEWKFKIQFRRQHQLEVELDDKHTQVEALIQQLELEHEKDQVGIQKISLIYKDRIRQQLYQKETEQLNKNKQHLVLILSQLTQIQSKLAKASQENSDTTSNVQGFYGNLHDLYKAADNISGEIKSSIETSKQQLKKSSEHLQQILVKVEEERSRIKTQQNAKLKSKKSKGIQRDMDYNILTIANKLRPLGEAPEVVTYIEKVSPRPQHKNEGAIYLMFLVFFIMAHYVVM